MTHVAARSNPDGVLQGIRWATLTTERPHPPKNSVPQVEVVPKCRSGVQSCERKEGVCEIAVDIFRRAEYGAILFDARIDLEKPKVEYTAVIDKCDNAYQRDDEQKSVQRNMHGARKSACELTQAARHRRRVMPKAPQKSSHEQQPKPDTQHRMYVDPEGLCLLRPVIVQQSEYADDDHEQKRQPVEDDGRSAVPARLMQGSRALQRIRGHAGPTPRAQARMLSP